MRYFALIFVVLVFAFPTIAQAAPGGGKGPPADKGPDKSDKGSSPPPPGPPAPPAGAPTPPADPPLTPAQISDDQDSALSAVQSGQALPLSEITRRAVAQWGGRLIDAKLMRRGTGLVYQLTLVSDRGAISRVFVDAKTAAPMGAT
jgi:hypothetical protein